jgi:hypothetical protein
MTESPNPGSSSRSSVSTKIFLIVAIFSLPIGVLAYLLAANYTPQIDTARLELAGNATQKPLMKALWGLNSAVNALRSCEGSACGGQMASHLASVNASFAEAQSQIDLHSADLKVSSEDLTKKSHSELAFNSLRASWSALASASTETSAPEQRAQLVSRYEKLSGEINQLVGYIGDTSNLILDPDLDSYYLVDVTLLTIPETVSHLANAASLGQKIVSGAGTPVEQAQLATESSVIQKSLERIRASNNTSFDSDAANHGVSASLQPKLTAAFQQYQSALVSYLASLRLASAGPAQIKPDNLAAEASAVQKASYDYWNTAAGELDILLSKRIEDFETSRVQALGFSALAVLIAAVVAFLLGRSITAPLQELVRNLGPGATLLAVSVERIAEASQSQTPSQEEAAIICEELNAHADNMRKAVLELARHVEGSGSNSQMADANGHQTQK